MTFVDLILPLAVPQLYTYSVPPELEKRVKTGQRVLVQFGKKKIISAIISLVHSNAPKSYEAKPILELLDEYQLLHSQQLKLIEWIAQYYMCTQGEVLKAAIPTGLRISSESMIEINPNIEPELDNIDERERIIMEALNSKEVLSLSDVEQLLNKKSIHKYIKSLLSRDYIVIYEELSEKYNPKKVKKISFADQYQSEEDLNDLFKKLEKRVKQTDVLLYILSRLHEGNISEIPKNEITQNANLSDSALKTLIKNGVIIEYDVIETRFPEYKSSPQKIILSENQQRVYDNIQEAFSHNKPCLLHGVTSSGKTEIYCKLAREVLDRGEQVLYLVPEIGLSTQLVSRLKSYFGNDLGVYHSKYSDNERVEIWRGIEEKRFNIILGTRSSIFLPFQNPGLIIIDEEHDASFKQSEPNPRFNARDTAFVLAKLHESNLILGSATPSFEMYYNAKEGKLELMQLNERYGKAIPPEIEIIDLKRAIEHRDHQGLFSNQMLNEIRSRIKLKEQVIVFQNRRGYTPSISCNLCHWTPKCTRCDVSLTLHRYTNDLRCHYCGYKKTMPANCESCGSNELQDQGYGTERIELELKKLIPEAKTGRMDLETTKTKTAFEKIIHDFETRKFDILVGTQMVTKGMDFENVTLVVVVNADNMLSFPDFRAEERTFQLLTQVSGRAGRRLKQGTVLIQTFSPRQEIFRYVTKQDYESFYTNKLIERQSFNYPPISRLINLKIKHREKQTALAFASKLTDMLKQILSHKNTLGPSTPAINRIRNLYIYEILLKFDRNLNNEKVKRLIGESIDKLKNSHPDYKYMKIIVDVDPV